MTEIRPREVPCRKCGAPVGEKCRPLTVWYGSHLERLVDAGGFPRPRQ